MTSLMLNVSKAAARSGNAGGLSPIKRSFHRTSRRQAIMMPAISPFMLEGNITKWTKKEGEAFAAGDVLLQIESDYTTVEVQAENPGIIGKILMPDGATGIRVEQVIALVAKDAKELAKIQSLARPPPLLTPSTMSPTVMASSPLIAPSPSNLSSFSASLPFSPRTVSTPPATPRSFTSVFEQAQQSFFQNTVHRSPVFPDHHILPSSEIQASGAASVRAMSTTSGSSASNSDLPVMPPSQLSSVRDSQEGLALRRKVLSGLASSAPGTFASESKGSTAEYFDGII